MSDQGRDHACVTCADELIVVRLERISRDGLTAAGVSASGTCEVALDLIEGARVGEVVLVHGGVALQRAPEGAAP